MSFENISKHKQGVIMEEVKKVGRPVGTARAKKSIRKEQYHLLMKYVDESSFKPVLKLRYKRAFTLLYYLGVRVGELLLLQVKDLRLAVSSGEASLTNRTKTKKPRHLMFTAGAIAAIEELFDDYLSVDIDSKHFHDPEHIIFHSPNKPKIALNKSTWTKTINNIIHDCLGPLYSSHSNRKGVLEDFAKKGTNPRIAQRFIGHSSVNTTNNYFDPDEDDVRSALDQIR